MLSGKFNAEISVVGGEMFHPIFLRRLDNHSHCNRDIQQAIIPNTSEEVLRLIAVNLTGAKVYLESLVLPNRMKIFGVR